MHNATQKPARTLRSDLRAVRHFFGNKAVAETLTVIWLAATYLLIMITLMALGGTR